MTCSVISLGGKLASLLQEDTQSEAFKDSDSKALGEKEETLKGISALQVSSSPISPIFHLPENFVFQVMRKLWRLVTRTRT